MHSPKRLRCKFMHAGGMVAWREAFICPLQTTRRSAAMSCDVSVRASARRRVTFLRELKANGKLSSSCNASEQFFTSATLINSCFVSVAMRLCCVVCTRAATRGPLVLRNASTICFAGNGSSRRLQRVSGHHGLPQRQQSPPPRCSRAASQKKEPAGKSKLYALLPLNICTSPRTTRKSRSYLSLNDKIADLAGTQCRLRHSERNAST